MPNGIHRAAAPLVAAALLLFTSVVRATDARVSGDWRNPDTWTLGPPGPADGALVSGFALTLTQLGQAAALRNDGLVDVKAADAPSADVGRLIVYSSMIVGYEAGGGLMLRQGGSALTRDTILGYRAGSLGTVTVDGSQTDAGGRRSSWSNSGNLSIGSSGFGSAEGEVRVFNGGLVESYNTAIGNGASKGRVSVSAATWKNANLFTVGSGGVSGALTVSGGGTVTSLTSVIGYGAGAGASLSGTLGTALLDRGNWINSGDFTAGAYARAELTAVNQSRMENAVGYLGYGDSASVNARISNSIWRNTSSLLVGYYGRATLLIEQGATVSSSDATIAYAGRASASVTVDNANWINSGELYIGYGAAGPNGSNADGSLSLRNGAFTSSASAFLGYTDTARGTASIGGAGPGGRLSEWNINGDLRIGHRGLGVLTLDGGGIVKSRSTIVGEGGTGDIFLNGSDGARGILQTSQVSGSFSGNGSHLSFNGGVLRADADQPRLLQFLPAIQVGAAGAYIDSNDHDIGSDVAMAGAGGLHKIGPGSFDLRANASFGSLSTVEGGRLRVNGLFDGDIEVGPGAVLGGSGRIIGRVTVGAGGMLQPGNSPGTLRVGSLFLSPTSALQIEIGGAGDLVEVAGDLTLDGRIDLIGDASALASGSFGFIRYGGVLANHGLTVGTLPAGLNASDFAFDFSQPGVVSIAPAVPEAPSLFLLLGGMLLLSLRHLRRPTTR